MSAATENVNRELGHLHASRRFALPTPVCVGTLLPSITQLTALGGMTRGGQRATTAFGPSGALAPRAPVGTLFRLRQTLTTRFRYWHLADRLHRCSDVRFDPSGRLIGKKTAKLALKLASYVGNSCVNRTQPINETAWSQLRLLFAVGRGASPVPQSVIPTA